MGLGLGCCGGPGGALAGLGGGPWSVGPHKTELDDLKRLGLCFSLNFRKYRTLKNEGWHRLGDSSRAHPAEYQIGSREGKKTSILRKQCKWFKIILCIVLF